MKKIFLITILVFLLTGCSVEYNLIIDKNLEVIEEVNMTGTPEFFKTYNKTSKLNVIKMLFDDYNEGLLKDNGYSYQIVDSETPYLLANKKYSTLKEYSDDTIFFQQFFEEIKYSENGNLIKIETVGFDPNEPDNPERFNISNLTIKIKSPFVVTSHNAIKVDENTNTYYYKIDNDTKDFSLILEFDRTKEFNPYIKTYFLISFSILVILFTWIIIYHYDKRNNLKKEKV